MVSEETKNSVDELSFLVYNGGKRVVIRVKVIAYKNNVRGIVKLSVIVVDSEGEAI